MKKVLFILVVFLTGINFVSAKEVALTCIYNNDVSVSGDANWKVGIQCIIYDDYSHQCYLERGSDTATQNSNKASIINWSSPKDLGWAAQADMKVEIVNDGPVTIMMEINNE